MVKFKSSKPKEVKPQEYIETLRFPVFSNYAMHIVFTDDLVASLDARDLNVGDTITNDNTDACCTTDDGDGYLFFVTHEISVGTIAHEAWHAVRAMLLGVSAELDNEVVAYHIGYTVDKIVKFRHEAHAKRRKR